MSFQYSIIPNQIDIEQVDKTANVQELCSVLEKANAKINQHPAMHARVSLYTEDESYNTFHNVLLDYKYDLFAEKCAYQKQLADEQTLPSYYRWEAVGRGKTTENKLLEVWEACMKSSANQASTRHAEMQLQDVKALLGDAWQSSCRLIYQGDLPIAMTIPHLEPGKNGEGRIYYIGSLPNVRGQGVGRLVHAASLFMLQEMGAAVYKGSTHAANIPMQHVFRKNGCIEGKRIATYYKGI
jgi:ribosomal protein S18 acetylase RimI-like enzyme